MGFSLFRRVGGSKLGGGRMMSSWRALLMVPPLSDDSGKLHKVGSRRGAEETRSYAMSGGDMKRVQVVGMSHGWLALYNEVSHGMQMLNPINGQRIQLPSLPDPQSGRVSRVVLSHSPSPSPDTDIGRAVMIYGGGRKVAFCVPGRSKEWTLPHADDDVEREYEDVIIFRGFHQSLYLVCLTRRPMELETWDVTDPHSPPILDLTSSGVGNVACPWRSQQDWELKNKCWRIKYLVHGSLLGHSLYLVVRYVIPPSRMQKQHHSHSHHPYKTIDFDVYGLGDGSATFGYLKGSFDDMAIFIGTNHSTAVTAWPDLKPNCIYFTDDNRLMHMSTCFECLESRGLDNGIFDYKNNTFSTCSCGDSDCPLDNPNTDRMDPAPIWFHFS